MCLTLWTTNELTNYGFIARIVTLWAEATSGVRWIVEQLIKEKEYRYRDGSVPFLRNIRNIGGAGCYSERISLKALERRPFNANQRISD